MGRALGRTFRGYSDTHLHKHKYIFIYIHNYMQVPSGFGFGGSELSLEGLEGGQQITIRNKGTLLGTPRI